MFLPGNECPPIPREEGGGGGDFLQGNEWPINHAPPASDKQLQCPQDPLSAANKKVSPTASSGATPSAKLGGCATLSPAVVREWSTRCPDDVDGCARDCKCEGSLGGAKKIELRISDGGWKMTPPWICTATHIARTRLLSGDCGLLQHTHAVTLSRGQSPGGIHGDPHPQAARRQRGECGSRGW